VPLNSTMIAVALPEIADHFGSSTGGASVLVTVYLVAMLLGQPPAGRLCDVVGARRMALVSTTGFGIFSAAAMFAGSFWLLVVLRAAQAAFAAGLAPSVQAMLREVVPSGERGRAFGLQGSVLGVGAGLGPVVGGLATAAFGWRAIFAVNLPVVLAVLYVLERRVARSAAPSEPDPVVAPGPPARLLSGVLGAAFSIQALATLAQYALLLVVPIVLDHRGWTAGSIGVALSLLTLGMVLAGPYGGDLGDALGRRRPVQIGLALAVVAVTASALNGDDVVSPVLVVSLLLFGIGFGLATPNLMTAGLEAVPVARSGSAAGLLSASRYVGSITSTVVLAGVVHDDGGGLQVLLAVCVASLALSLVVAGRLPGRQPVPVDLVP
jgi:MFS family permease